MYLCSGIGGVIGSLLGGYFTKKVPDSDGFLHSNTKWCFFWYSWIGLLVSFMALFLTNVSEADSETERENSSDEQQNRVVQNIEGAIIATPNRPPKGFCYNLKQNFKTIGKAIQMREIYLVLIFFVIKGLLNPSFEDFSYFFLMDIIKISAMVYSLLAVLGQIFSIFGAIAFRAFFKNVETRNMVMWAFISSVIFSTLQLGFSERLNLKFGINDNIFLIFTDVVGSIVFSVLFTLPILSLFAKITPPKVEGTIFAFLTGTMNLANTVLSPSIGVMVNK
jgi:Na+/melibiose symporter-like transporter